MSKRQMIFIFVLGIGVGIIAWNLVGLLGPTPAYAQARGENSGTGSGIIAVTGLCSQSYSGLWVIDTRDTEHTPTVCLYIPESGGRSGFSFAGARKIKYDLKLIQYRDRTTKKMTPGKIKLQLPKLNKED